MECPVTAYHHLGAGKQISLWILFSGEITRVFVQLQSDIEIFYAPLICITKLSILLQYLRVFVPLRTGTIYYLICGLIWLNVVLYSSVCVVEICQCIPRSKIWEPNTPGHCINNYVAFIITACFNVVSDFSILLLPIGCIWNLQMTTRRKIELSSIFTLGLL